MNINTVVNNVFCINSSMTIVPIGCDWGLRTCVSWHQLLAFPILNHVFCQFKHGLRFWQCCTILSVTDWGLNLKDKSR